MKKYLIIGILALVVLMPLASSTNPTLTINHETTPLQNSVENSTHSVMVEYATLTTCPPCVTASSQLNNIYNSGDLNFYFVSLVADEANLNIRSRISDLGVSSVPDVYFDGGYRRVLGGQSSEAPYRNAITSCGLKAVPDIDIDVSADWKGNGAIKITVNVQNNEPDEYNGILRVYIVEIESRWDDNGGHPYHYAAIGMPIDRSLSMPKGDIKPLGDTYTFSKTWIGSIYGFSDITKENIMIIASVFDAETGHAVQAASTEPTSSTSQFYEFIMSRPIMKIFQLLMGKEIFNLFF